MNKKKIFKWILYGIILIILVVIVDLVIWSLRREERWEHPYSVTENAVCLFSGKVYEIGVPPQEFRTKEGKRKWKEKCCHCNSSDYGQYVCNPKPENYERDCPSG